MERKTVRREKPKILTFKLLIIDEVISNLTEKCKKGRNAEGRLEGLYVMQMETIKKTNMYGKLQA